MPRETKFDADKLRILINEGKSAQQIMDAFEIKKPMLKNYIIKLTMIDQKFYTIEGISERSVFTTPKFSKTGLHLSPAKLKSYGFKLDDEFKVSSPENGKIVLEKI